MSCCKISCMRNSKCNSCNCPVLCICSNGCMPCTFRKCKARHYSVGSMLFSFTWRGSFLELLGRHTHTWLSMESRTYLPSFNVPYYSPTIALIHIHTGISSTYCQHPDYPYSIDWLVNGRYDTCVYISIYHGEAIYVYPGIVIQVMVWKPGNTNDPNIKDESQPGKWRMMFYTWRT